MLTRIDWLSQETTDTLPHRVVPRVVQLGTQSLQGRPRDHAVRLEHLEEARRPAAQHDDPLGVCRGVEVSAVGRDVPDDDGRHLPAHPLAPEVLTSALERLADSLHVGLPLLCLHVVTVAVPREGRALTRAAGGVPRHVREDDEVLWLLPIDAASRLQTLKHQLHCLLEVSARALSETVRDGRHALEDVTLG